MNRPGDRSEHRKRVAMLVWNTVEHDARVRNEARSLAENGFEVTILGLHAPGRTSRREQLEGGARVDRFGRIPGARLVSGKGTRAGGWSLFPIALVQLSMVLRVIWRRPGFVHAHDVNMLLIAWIAARLCGARLIYDAHEISTSREGYSRMRRLVAGLERCLARRADAMITTTSLRAKFFARAYDVPRPLVLQNRPRFQAWAPGDRIRKELGLSADRPVVLYQGSFLTGRGLEMIVRTAGQVPEADFVLIGSGKHGAVLRELADDLGVNDRIHFVPAVPVGDLPSYTASADVGLQVIENTCLNHFTTDSNKLFEYIQAGLPMVVSDLPEMAHIVHRYQVGLLITPGDEEALVAAVRRLVTDAGLRQAMRESARVAARELCWELQDHKLVALYRQLSEQP